MRTLLYKLTRRFASLFREQQNQQRKKKKKLSRKNVPNDTTTTYTATDNDTDAFSTAGTDIGDDEFFDCSDSENGISDIESRSVHCLYIHDYTVAVLINFSFSM